MKKIIFIVPIFLAILIFHGCNNNNSPTPNTNNMDDMVVPNGFTFETTRELPINITMPESIDFTNLRSRFNIYTNNLDEGGKLLSSGSFDANGKYSGIIKVPTTISEVTVSTIAGTITTTLLLEDGGTYKADDLIIDFGGDYGYFAPDTIEPNKKQNKKYNYQTVGYNSYTSPNLVSNGNFEVNDFGAIYIWSSPHPNDSRWYFTQKTGSMEWYNDEGNPVVRTPITEPGNYYYGGTSQFIDANPGDVITMTADIKSVGNNGNLYSWLYLIPVNASGNALAYYNLRYFNPTNTWTNKTLTATMPSGTVMVNVLIWTNDYRPNAAIYVDNVIVTGPIIDTDGDGVDDDIDDYPTDATRAFNVYYPNETDWGTFAFEDLWPGKGDYDFNDLILDFQFKSVLNSSNELVEFFTEYSVRAIGASLTNGFAFMIEGNPSNVAAITGTNITENYLTLNANGTEQNQPNTVIFLFDNVFSMIGSSGGSFINTVDNGVYVEPDTNLLHVSYTNPITSSGIAPYNPFIVFNRIRGIEIHLAGQEPTALADLTLFGTFADDSNPATGKYYQTYNNLPWAIDLPVSFDYPIEQVQITNAYNYFRVWGESGGNTYTDWYENNSGYRNNDNVYSPPN